MRPGLLTTITLGVIFLSGCSDLGTNPSASNQPMLPPSQNVSFKNQITPIFVHYGCDACHGGSGGLFVQTVAQLLQGGLHGPAVIPGKADSSVLVRKISPNQPFGDRMPQGGPYLPDTTIQLISLWINQGAKDN